MRSVHHVACLCLLAFAATLGSTRAEELKVEENPVPANSFAVVSYTLLPGDKIKWEVRPEPTKFKTYEEVQKSPDGKTVWTTAYCLFNGPANAKYEVTADVINFKSEKWDRKRTIVEIGKVPKPPPDIDPKPPTPPDPPKPDPVGLLRVIFVYETNKPLTREQRNAVDSPAVEKYLNEKCSKDAKGKPEWKEFDPNQQFAAGFNPTLKSLFTDSLTQAKEKLPAVVIAVGQNAKVYQVTNEAELLALLKKHAEGK